MCDQRIAGGPPSSGEQVRTSHSTQQPPRTLREGQPQTKSLFQDMLTSSSSSSSLGGKAPHAPPQHPGDALPAPQPTPKAAAQPATTELQCGGQRPPQRRGAKQRPQDWLPVPPIRTHAWRPLVTKDFMERQGAGDKSKLACPRQNAVTHRSGGAPRILPHSLHLRVPVYLDGCYADPAPMSSRALLQIPRPQGRRMRPTRVAACSAARPLPWPTGWRPQNSVRRPRDQRGTVPWPERGQS